MKKPFVSLFALSTAAIVVLAACAVPADRPKAAPRAILPDITAASVGAAQSAGQTAASAPAANAIIPTAESTSKGSGAATSEAIEQGAVVGPVLGTIEIKGVDLGFTPNNTTVDAPGRYTIKFTNAGQLIHDITFPNGTKLTAKPGETVEGDIMVPVSGAKFICSVPGHKDAGMVGTVTVKGNTVNVSEGGDHGGPAVAIDVQPNPNAPAPVLYNPAAPKLLEGTVHDIDLVIIEKLMTVAKGFQVAVWTFGGTVPGPVIRVKVGDTIRIHLKNPKESKLPHSVDFHSSQVAWNGPMTSINPGEEKLYTWTADYAGVWMYHCGTPPGLHHIANGMYGMVIVEPKEGLPKADHEFAFVQSEWYLGPQAEPVSLLKAAAAAPAPDYVVFNGVADQYGDNPVEIGTGKRVRVFALNAGPNTDSSFHVVGAIFDTVTKEGVTLARGNPGNYASQAVDLSPAQGAIIEFQTADDGLYPFVTHAFNFVGRGALGVFKSGDGKPKKP